MNVGTCKAHLHARMGVTPFFFTKTQTSIAFFFLLILLEMSHGTIEVESVNPSTTGEYVGSFVAFSWQADVLAQTERLIFPDHVVVCTL